MFGKNNDDNGLLHLSFLLSYSKKISNNEPTLLGAETFAAPKFVIMTVLVLMVQAHALAADIYRPANCPVVHPLPVAATPASPLPVEMVDALADRIELQGDQSVRIEGGVELHQGTRNLRAETVTLDSTQQHLHAEGTVTLSDRNLELKGASLSADMNNSSAHLTDTEYRLTDRGIHGAASSFDVQDNGFISLKDATFTSCPGNDPAWLLTSDEMKLDQKEGWGEARHMRLDLGGVPVVYLPYITFPIDDRRRSGVLIPSVGSSAKNGIDIAVPYYLNLDPSYDATVTPRLIGKRGLQIGSEFRYLGEASTGEISATVLKNDTEDHGEDRWAFALKHRTDFSENWVGQIDAAGVSDDRYFSDLGSGLVGANKTYLPRASSLRFQDEHWRVSAATYEVQALQTATALEPYKKLPEVRYDGLYNDVFDGLDIGVNGVVTRFEHPVKTNGERYHAEPFMRLPLQAEWGYLKTTVRHYSTHYEYYEHAVPAVDPLNTGEPKISENRDINSYSIDAGLNWERDLRWFNRELVQTLEPRVYYLDVPFVDQQSLPLFDTTIPTESYQSLFRDNRYIGVDRIGDTRQISYGISSRFFSKLDGEDVLRLSLGQTEYLRDRKVGLLATDPVDTASASPMYLEAALFLNDHWDVRSTVGWEPSTSETSRGSLAMRYEPDERRIVNVEYRYRQVRNVQTEQAETGFYWPVSNRWQVVGRYARDMILGRQIETLFGLEYESCCWATRLVARHYLNVDLNSNGVAVSSKQYDSGVYFQFIFKGLGAAGGSGLRSLLSDSIDGFTDRLSPQ